MKRWPLGSQITLALGGAMLLMSVLAGEYVRALETQYVLAGLAIQQHVTWMYLVSLSIVALVTASIVLLVHWLAIWPLHKINQRLIALAQGDLTTPLTASGSRELVQLSDSVNALGHAFKELQNDIAERRRAEEDSPGQQSGQE